MSKARVAYIDTLRCIAILLIILAHVHPPQVLFELRLFDVVLIVFVSGLSYSGRQLRMSASYLLHRVLRLLVPLYICLTVLFISAYLLSPIYDLGYDLNTIVGSYCLVGGINFIWIFRVFLLIAIISPLLSYCDSKLHNVGLWVMSAMGILVFSDVLQSLGVGREIKLFEHLVYFTLGYSVVFMAGLKFPQLSIKKSGYCTIVFMVVCLGLIVRNLYNGGRWLGDPFAIKYPPHLIYIVYGLMMSSILYMILSRKQRTNSLVSFIGMNTNWIYLWHILFVIYLHPLSLNWYIYYFAVLAGSVSSTYIQVKLVRQYAVGKRAWLAKYFVG